MRDLWRACLVTKASFEQIAAFLGEKVQVIRLFSALFWNVRLSVGPSAVALMQLAYTEGADRLARTVELANETLSPESMPEQYQRLERRIVSRANAGMDYGLNDAKSNPTLRAAQALLLARKRAEEEKDNDRRRSLDDEMGFGRISADKSCQMIIRQVTQRSAMEKLKLAQEYDTKQAAAAAAKKAVDV